MGCWGLADCGEMAEVLGMRSVNFVLAVLWVMGGVCGGAWGQGWKDRVRGSWVRVGEARDGDVVLVDDKGVVDIVVGEGENSAVKRAGECLASDIEKITGKKPTILSQWREGKPAIRLLTKATDAWESYQIQTAHDHVLLMGSDFRGTAFAAYTLCERLGIDPLYLWTGYLPERRGTLVMKKTDAFFPSPTIKYRGMFHDDEDILPRPFEMSGYPFRLGDVPLAWYEKYFETALRLRMNMVAPYTRVHRRNEVQKTASEWGLFYTSHHYDILLSNPFGILRYGLGEKRRAGTTWDWISNREGMLNFWRGGVEENKGFNCVWPVGLRGTDDAGYTFPKEMGAAEKAKIFAEVIETQVKMTTEMLSKDKTPVFHFTMYHEVLNEYLKDPKAFGLPENVIVVWVDDNDGRMRYLPEKLGKWKHGVYYHLAYLGPVAKQSAPIVTPATITTEFRKIVDCGATEYLLFNVSELREFVMEARLLAEIGWDAKTALADTARQERPRELLGHVPSTKESRVAGVAASQPSHEDSADRYVSWWCREYFGEEAGMLAEQVYHRNYELLNSYDKAWYGSDQVQAAIDLLMKGSGELNAAGLAERNQRFAETFKIVEKARAKMDRQQRQFFFDHVELPMLMDWRPVQAAIVLAKAAQEKDERAPWSLCESAMKPLEQLEVEIARAEHPPFEGWYRKTWIRRENQDLNVHRPFEQLRAFLASGGKEKLKEPEGARKPVFPVRKD